MKKLPVYFILAALISFSFGFASNDIKNDPPKTKSECPYIQSLKNSDCPYLNGKIDSNYFDQNKEDKSETKCPYLNNMKERKSGCPYMDWKSNRQKNYKKIKDNWKNQNS
jgi:hypothetical protein